MAHWQEIRSYFPALQKYVYLTTAGGGPMSTLAHRAAVSFYDAMLTDGDKPWNKWLARVEAIRQQTAAFIDADPVEVAFVQNTSHGMSTLAQMLRGRGDVIAMDDDFPTATIPFLKQGFHIEYVTSDDHCVIRPTAIEAAMTPASRVLVLSAVQYATGFRQDLEECSDLCKKHGLLLIVDASQQLGVFPLNVKKAGMDFMVSSGNKWLGAGYGIGLLYIRRELIDSALFPAAGWMSVKQPTLMDNRSTDFKDTAAMLETGGPAFPNIFALGGALELLKRIGMPAIQERIYELTSYLLQQLRDGSFSIVSSTEELYRSAITIIDVPDKRAVASQLNRRNILVAARRRGIRVAVHFFNTFAEIDTLIAALKELAPR